MATGKKLITRDEFERWVRNLRYELNFLGVSGGGSESSINWSNLPDSEINVYTDSYVLVLADLGRTCVMNSAANKILSLPSVAASHIGAFVTFWKIGAGKLTIQAADSDTINDSGAGGTLYNDLADEIYACVRIRLIQETKWMIEFFTGSGWKTS